MMRRFRAIIQSNKEPEDKEVLWLFKKRILYWDNEEWRALKFLGGEDIAIDGIPGISNVQEVYDAVYSRMDEVSDKIDEVNTDLLSKINYNRALLSIYGKDLDNLFEYKAETLEPKLYGYDEILDRLSKTMGWQGPNPFGEVNKIDTFSEVVSFLNGFDPLVSLKSILDKKDNTVQGITDFLEGMNLQIPLIETFNKLVEDSKEYIDTNIDNVKSDIDRINNVLGFNGAGDSKVDTLGEIVDFLHGFERETPLQEIIESKENSLYGLINERWEGALHRFADLNEDINTINSSINSINNSITTHSDSIDYLQKVVGYQGSNPFGKEDFTIIDTLSEVVDFLEGYTWDNRKSSTLKQIIESKEQHLNARITDNATDIANLTIEKNLNIKPGIEHNTERIAALEQRATNIEANLGDGSSGSIPTEIVDSSNNVIYKVIDTDSVATVKESNIMLDVIKAPVLILDCSKVTVNIIGELGEGGIQIQNSNPDGISDISVTINALGKYINNLNINTSGNPSTIVVKDALLQNIFFSWSNTKVIFDNCEFRQGIHSYSADIEFRNCFLDFSNNSSLELYNSRSVVIRDCLLVNMSGGLELGANDVQITGCTIKESSQGSTSIILMGGDDINNTIIRFENNKMVDQYGHTTSYREGGVMLRLRNAGSVFINNNMGLFSIFEVAQTVENLYYTNNILPSSTLYSACISNNANGYTCISNNVFSNLMYAIIQQLNKYNNNTKISIMDNSVQCSYVVSERFSNDILLEISNNRFNSGPGTLNNRSLNVVTNKPSSGDRIMFSSTNGIGPGTEIYCTSDNKKYYWNGSSWVG